MQILSRSAADLKRSLGLIVKAIDAGEAVGPLEDSGDSIGSAQLQPFRFNRLIHRPHFRQN